MQKQSISRGKLFVCNVGDVLAALRQNSNETIKLTQIQNPSLSHKSRIININNSDAVSTFPFKLHPTPKSPIAA